MKAKEIREKTVGELRELEAELREKLFRLKMHHYTGQLESVAELQATKRDIARVLTVIREREAGKA
ncbi:MAG: 50S ribosomal protein L29 [Myxococcales bacterium]|nr:50S ribosomal protein L29 [Myxococcales bacterium]